MTEEQRMQLRRAVENYAEAFALKLANQAAPRADVTQAVLNNEYADAKFELNKIINRL